MKNKRIEIRIPKKPEFLLVVRLVVAGIANGQRFTAEEIDDIKLAVGEACFSTMRNDGRKEEDELKIVCHLKKDALILDIETRSRKPALPFSTTDEESMGFFLMEHLMDRIEYNSDKDGSLIRLVKARKVPELSASSP